MACTTHLAGSVFIYAPGVALPWANEHTLVRQTCRAVKNLRIFDHDEQLETQMYLASRMAIITDTAHRNIVYIPIFVDFYASSGLSDRYIAQERDIADIYYLHRYAMKHHDGPIHMLGHSRGAGTLATYMGLLWHNPAYIHSLAIEHCSQLLDAYHDDWHIHDDMLRRHIGALCCMGTFNTLAQTIHNVLDALYMPNRVQYYISSIAPSMYNHIKSMIPVPKYDWHTPYTPYAMIEYIPSHIPIAFIHTDADPINPVWVVRDMYEQRVNVAPDCTFFYVAHNTMAIHIRHIEVPYRREVAEVSDTLCSCITYAEALFTE